MVSASREEPLGHLAHKVPEPGLRRHRPSPTPATGFPSRILACPSWSRLFFFFPFPKGVTYTPPPHFTLSLASGLKPITLLCKQSEGQVWGEGTQWEGARGARAAVARQGGRSGGWTGGRPPRRCTSGFVGASVFVPRTNGERTRRWALERRKIHISSTALASQRPPAHFPRRRSPAPRSAAAACPRRCPRPPCRRHARRAPQRQASSSPGWLWARAGARVTAAASAPLPQPRAARLPVASHWAGWLHRAGLLQDVRDCEDGRA